jgi:hypothetical protein
MINRPAPAENSGVTPPLTGAPPFLATFFGGAFGRVITTALVGWLALSLLLAVLGLAGSWWLGSQQQFRETLLKDVAKQLKLADVDWHGQVSLGLGWPLSLAVGVHNLSARTGHGSTLVVPSVHTNWSLPSLVASGLPVVTAWVQQRPVSPVFDQPTWLPPQLDSLTITRPALVWVAEDPWRVPPPKTPARRPGVIRNTRLVLKQVTGLVKTRAADDALSLRVARVQASDLLAANRPLDLQVSGVHLAGGKTARAHPVFQAKPPLFTMKYVRLSLIPMGEVLVPGYVMRQDLMRSFSFHGLGLVSPAALLSSASVLVKAAQVSPAAHQGLAKVANQWQHMPDGVRGVLEASLAAAALEGNYRWQPTTRDSVWQLRHGQFMGRATSHLAGSLRWRGPLQALTHTGTTMKFALDALPFDPLRGPGANQGSLVVVSGYLPASNEKRQSGGWFWLDTQPLNAEALYPAQAASSLKLTGAVRAQEVVFRQQQRSARWALSSGRFSWRALALTSRQAPTALFQELEGRLEVAQQRVLLNLGQSGRFLNQPLRRTFEGRQQRLVFGSPLSLSGLSRYAHPLVYEVSRWVPYDRRVALKRTAASMQHYRVSGQVDDLSVLLARQWVTPEKMVYGLQGRLSGVQLAHQGTVLSPTVSLAGAWLPGQRVTLNQVLVSHQGRRMASGSASLDWQTDRAEVSVSGQLNAWRGSVWGGWLDALPSGVAFESSEAPYDLTVAGHVPDARAFEAVLQATSTQNRVSGVFDLWRMLALSGKVTLPGVVVTPTQGDKILPPQTLQVSSSTITLSPRNTLLSWQLPWRVDKAPLQQLAVAVRENQVVEARLKLQGLPAQVIHPWLTVWLSRQPKKTVLVPQLKGLLSGDVVAWTPPVEKALGAVRPQWLEDWQGQLSLEQALIGLHLPSISHHAPRHQVAIRRVAANLLPGRAYRVVGHQADVAFGDAVMQQLLIEGKAPVTPGTPAPLLLSFQFAPLATETFVDVLQQWTPKWANEPHPAIWHAAGQVQPNINIAMAGGAADHTYDVTFLDAGLSAPSLIGQAPVHHLNGKLHVRLKVPREQPVGAQPEWDVFTQDLNLLWGNSPAVLEMKRLGVHQGVFTVDGQLRHVLSATEVNQLAQWQLQDITARDLDLQLAGVTQVHLTLPFVAASHPGPVFSGALHSTFGLESSDNNQKHTGDLAQGVGSGALPGKLIVTANNKAITLQEFSYTRPEDPPGLPLMRGDGYWLFHDDKAGLQPRYRLNLQTPKPAEVASFFPPDQRQQVQGTVQLNAQLTPVSHTGEVLPPWFNAQVAQLRLPGWGIHELTGALRSENDTLKSSLLLHADAFKAEGIDTTFSGKLNLVEWLLGPGARFPVPLQEMSFRGKQLDIASLQSIFKKAQDGLIRPVLLPMSQSIVQQPWSAGSGLGVTFEQAPFHFDEVVVNNIIIKQVRGNLAMHPSGFIYLKPLRYQLAGGSVESRMLLNPLENNYLSMELVANQVKANPLTYALLGVSNRVFGNLDAKLQVTTRGVTTQEMLDNANGQCVFNIQEGRLPDLNQIERLLTAANLIRGGVLGVNLNGLAKLLLPEARISEGVSLVSGSVQIAEGVAYTSNLMTTGENLSLLFDGGMRLRDGVASMRIEGQSVLDTKGVFGGLGQLSVQRFLRTLPVIGFLPGGRPGLIGLLPGVGYVPGFGAPVSEQSKFAAQIEGPFDKSDSLKNFHWMREQR